MEVADVRSADEWVAEPTWIVQEQIHSFAGHPLIHRGEVLGVLGYSPGPSRGQPALNGFG